MNIEQRRNKAIITITKGGYALGRLLKSLYPGADLYANKKYVEDGDLSIENGVANLTKDIFNQYSSHIYIMATGIVIRAIAPNIKDKSIDPAVVVMDEKGKNIISLLSGHLGGANDLTHDIAHKIMGNPVITTASDTNNTLCVDMFAEELGLSMESLDKAKAITANILEGQSFCVLNELGIDIGRDGIPICTDMSQTKDYDNIIALTKDIKDVGQEIIHLRPKSIVIGIGCRRGKPWSDIYSGMIKALHLVDKNIFDIKHIATVDVKSDEIGLLELANKLKVRLDIIDRNKIRDVEHRFETSDFVKRTIGVGAVAEPVAFISSNSGRIILKKTRFDGVTIAIAEE